MYRHLFYGGASFVTAVALAGVLYAGVFEGDALNARVEAVLGSVFGVTITTQDLQETYEDEYEELHILLVPGHDLKHHGTQFGDLTEEKINRVLSRHLHSYLSDDSRFKVTTVRDLESGAYTEAFRRYFYREREDIRDFMQERRKMMREKIAEGKVDRNVSISHNFAPSDVAVQLYGINKWANEQDIDLLLHVHFNDHAGRRHGRTGKYNGFSIYVPERQYPNAAASHAFAAHIFDHLKRYNPPSDFRLEDAGVIEAQELIALGSNASQRGASVLIEYGYIYEDRFTHPEIRSVLTRELAYQTYRGIKSYFENDLNVLETDERTTMLPYDFSGASLQPGKRGSDVVALQTALVEEGVYPPEGADIQACPISGFYGSCTERSVSMFQERYADDVLRQHGLDTPTGLVGRATRAKLNEIYGI